MKLKRRVSFIHKPKTKAKGQMSVRAVKSIAPAFDDLKVYISTVNKEPSETSHQHSFCIADKNGRFSFKVEQPISWVYFTLKSEKGCSIEVQIDLRGEAVQSDKLKSRAEKLSQAEKERQALFRRILPNQQKYSYYSAAD